MHLMNLLCLSLVAAVASAAPLPPVNPTFSALPPVASSKEGRTCIKSEGKNRNPICCDRTEPWHIAPPPKLDFHLPPLPKIGFHHPPPPKIDLHHPPPPKIDFYHPPAPALKKGAGLVQDGEDGCPLPGTGWETDRWEAQGWEGISGIHAGKKHSPLLPGSAYTRETYEGCKDRWKAQSMAGLSRWTVGSVFENLDKCPVPGWFEGMAF